MTGLVVDLGNLYYAAQAKFERRILISKYVEYLESMGHQIAYKVAYTKQREEDARGFATMLRKKGWELHCEPSSAIAMAIRAGEMMSYIDKFVLGTNYLEAGRILAWMKRNGKETTCLALNIPKVFHQYANCIEVPECTLEPSKATEQLDMLTNVPGDGAWCRVETSM